MKSFARMEQDRLDRDIREWCDAPEYDDDGNEIKYCPDCGCRNEMCRCEPEED